MIPCYDEEGSGNFTSIEDIAAELADWLLEKAFSTDEYSKEDLKYIAEVLKFMSARTIWHTFDSCNNYKMPEKIRIGCKNVEYWYSELELKDRKWDIEYVKKHFPKTTFKMYKGIGHGGLAALQPELMTFELIKVIDDSEKAKYSCIFRNGEVR